MDLTGRRWKIMKVNVHVTPKMVKEIVCARFRVVGDTLLFYSDVRMGNLLCGFKKWTRFFVTEENTPTPVKTPAKGK